ncbi:unnamed protein product [Acanthoscelides obtectus]|uniref:Uncharacterized protein n=1 Tax=Acanthoscelides obtectus TaxID=200917 RepID=A0A9P0PWT9_ACAOB|nr:unnamed protein product [Acanthoscelides obtectus]CAK1656476.1 Sodium channel protein 60E [Acanthoscelides obtectus]
MSLEPPQAYLTEPHSDQPSATDEHDARVRPISYPCGPDSSVRLEVIEFSPHKRHSDPLQPPPLSSKAKTQVKPFTKESLEKLQRKTVQLVREYGFQPRRKLSVEDGSRLPAKYEPFPKKLYGRPLEEIDNFIYDEKLHGLNRMKAIF